MKFGSVDPFERHPDLGPIEQDELNSERHHVPFFAYLQARWTGQKPDARMVAISR
jgi:hypothetical protein